MKETKRREKIGAAIHIERWNPSSKTVVEGATTITTAGGVRTKTEVLGPNIARINDSIYVLSRGDDAYIFQCHAAAVTKNGEPTSGHLEIHGDRCEFHCDAGRLVYSQDWIEQSQPSTAASLP